MTSTRRVILPAALALLAAPGRSPEAQNLTPASAVGPTVEGQEIEGTITRLDPARRTIVLDDGQEYLIPPAVLDNPAALSEGAAVKLRYDVDGGRNIVKYVLVRA